MTIKEWQDSHGLTDEEMELIKHLLENTNGIVTQVSTPTLQEIHSKTVKRPTEEVLWIGKKNFGKVYR